MSDNDREDGLTTGSLSDRPEDSAIKQASPKSGLDTGSLSDRPPSAFDRNREAVAKQYEPALSGKEGALAQFDAFTELMRNQIEEYESGKVVSSKGDVSMQGFGQYMTLSSRRSEGRGGGVIEEPELAAVNPWDIVVSGESFGIAVGDIYKSFGSVDDTNLFTITGRDLTFTPSATRVVYLELENTSTPTITLKADTGWTGYPETFQLTTSGVIYAEKAFFRLWHGVSGDKPVNEFGIQYDGFWMKRTCRSKDLVIGYGSYELDDTFRHIAVPVLFPM